MLYMPSLPGYQDSNDIGCKFVNDRLIDLLTNQISSFVFYSDDPDSYFIDKSGTADWNKDLYKLVDADKLKKDEEFAEYISTLFPDWYDYSCMASEFFSLYDLLRAEESYIPSLLLYYVLYYLIREEIDECVDCNEEDKIVMSVPEPDRTKMMEDLKLWCLDSDGYEDEEELNEYLEDCMACYENLDNYLEYCFFDNDCLLLDDYTMDELKNSEFSKQIGLVFEGDLERISLGNTNISVDIPAWEADKLR